MYNTDKQQNECSDHGTYLFLHLFSFFSHVVCACFCLFLPSMFHNPPPLFLGEGGKRGMGWDGV